MPKVTFLTPQTQESGLDQLIRTIEFDFDDIRNFFNDTYKNLAPWFEKIHENSSDASFFRPGQRLSCLAAELKNFYHTENKTIDDYAVSSREVFSLVYDLSSVLSSAKIGAALGTILLPGIGTAAGLAAGATLGNYSKRYLISSVSSGIDFLIDKIPDHRFFAPIKEIGKRAVKTAAITGGSVGCIPLIAGGLVSGTAQKLAGTEQKTNRYNLFKSVSLFAEAMLCANSGFNGINNINSFFDYSPVSQDNSDSIMRNYPLEIPKDRTDEFSGDGICELSATSPDPDCHHSFIPLAFSPVQKEPEPAENTFLIYMSGDNNLGFDHNKEDDNPPATIADMQEMAEGLEEFDETDKAPRIFVLYDGPEDKDNKLYLINKSDKNAFYSAKSYSEELNMGDPDVLVKEVKYVIDEYPTERLNLIIWGHGNGILDFSGDSLHGLSEQVPEFRNVGYDRSHDDSLTESELRQAVEQISHHFQKPIDIIGFDACQMQMAEIASAFGQHAGIIAGTSQNMPYSGTPYHTWLNNLADVTEITPEKTAKAWVEAYGEEHTRHFSAMKIPNQDFYEKVDAFSGVSIAIIDEYDDEDENIREPFFHAKRLTPKTNDYYDLKTYLEVVMKRFAEDEKWIDKKDIENLQESAEDLIEYLNESTIANHRGEDEFTGFSIYIGKGYEGNYTDTLFAKETLWDEFLDAIYTNNNEDSISLFYENTPGIVSLQNPHFPSSM
ncbi:hypothetical protein GF327_06545 [Candidatus Woesearchaeota archaeon]|nr:hypothetical protein [Candidatus Woesearchaeota archaeon]